MIVNVLFVAVEGGVRGVDVMMEGDFLLSARKKVYIVLYQTRPYDA